jgi:hypothetical protein
MSLTNYIVLVWIILEDFLLVDVEEAEGVVAFLAVGVEAGE